MSISLIHYFIWLPFVCVVLNTNDSIFYINSSLVVPWTKISSFYKKEIIIYSFLYSVFIKSSLLDMQMIMTPQWICKSARDFIWRLCEYVLAPFPWKELVRLYEDLWVSLQPALGQDLCYLSRTTQRTVQSFTLALFILTYRMVEQLTEPRLQPRVLKEPLQTAACCHQSAGFCCRECPEAWWPSAAHQCRMNC